MACNDFSNIITNIRAFLLNEITFTEHYLIDRKDEQRGLHVYADKNNITIPDDAGMEILFKEETAEVSEKQSVGIGGYSYENTIEWEQPVTYEDADDLLSQLAVLQRHPHHILVEYFGGRKQIIRTNPNGDGYSLSTSEKSGSLTLTLTIRNVSGTRDIV